MDFTQNRNPTKHLTGIVFVVILHLAVGYALVTGLARKVVEVIKQPIETKIIEEIKPPPPDTPPPPPPKLATPPPPYIPPPEVQIQVPVQVQPTITAVTDEKPPPGPPPPPVTAAPAPPVVTRAVGVACPNSAAVRAEIQYPKEAIKQGLTGEVLIEFTVDGRSGAIKNVQVLNSTNRIFDRTSLAAVSKFKCVAQGQDVKVQVPIGFSLKD